MVYKRSVRVQRHQHRVFSETGVYCIRCILGGRGTPHRYVIAGVHVRIQVVMGHYINPPMSGGGCPGILLSSREESPF